MDINKIKEYAFRMHKDVNQKYGKHEYSYHLQGVVNVLKEFIEHPNDILIAGAYLHDILEDTQGTKEEILKISNLEVLDIIEKLTDKEGSNRKERHLNTYYLIRENENAVTIKLCDRIFNIRECLKTDIVKAKMYLKEHDSFLFSLFDPREIQNKNLWIEYNKLIISIKDELNKCQKEK